MPVTTSQPAATALVVGCVSFALFLTSFVGAPFFIWLIMRPKAAK